MAEQSRHAKEYTRSSHSTQEVTEKKLKSGLAHAMHDSRSRKGKGKGFCTKAREKTYKGTE